MAASAGVNCTDASSSFEEIPILDFNDLTTSKKEFLIDLRHAIVDIGFLYAKNFGLPASTITSLIDLLPSLFSLSESERANIELESSPHFLGYSAVGSETTAGKTDAREQFEFGLTQTSIWRPWRPGRPLYEKLLGPNQYPPSLPQTQKIVEEYMSAMAERARFFMGLVAEALELPEDTFLPFLGRQNRLKIVRYPPAQNGVESQGVGPHKDSSGWWTFLLQASSPEIKGLQVLNKAGKWIDVPNIPGTIVVNIGQAFEVVTHGMCKATTHRVLGGPHERFSVPFFLGVRGDLTKSEALGALADQFTHQSQESSEGAQIDSPFLRGNYDTWGESQLRTKIRSHRKAGKKFYLEVYDQYVNDT